MTPQSMWGNIKEQELVKAPVSFLREQAQLLSEKTGNAVRGEVEQFDSPYGYKRIGYRLNAVAPQLNGYTYEVMTIEHDIAFYPLWLCACQDNKTYECRDEASFLTVLQEVLSSKTVTEAIISLCAQSKI